jgi:hypothetical protein
LVLGGSGYMIDLVGNGLKFLVQEELVGTATVFDSVLDLMAEFGFFRVVLPFLLIFSIVYGILGRTKIFEGVKNRESIELIIAMAMAFFAIAAKPVVVTLAKLLPQASFLLVVVLLLLMVFSFMGFQYVDWWKVGEGKKLNIWQILIIIAVLAIFAGMIDYATGFEIPVIHQIAQGFVGGTGTVLSGEALSIAVGLGLAIGIPLLVVYLILKKD